MDGCCRSRVSTTSGRRSAVADFDDATRRLLTQKADAQPFGTYTQPLHLGREFAGEYGRVAILAGGFGMPADALRAMIAAVTAHSGPSTGDDWQFLELDTGHWPMLTAPDRLATMLLDVAAGQARMPAEARR